MDGTHKPTKMAAFSFPLKNNISENMSDRKAAAIKNLSAVVNFLSIIIKI